MMPGCKGADTSNPETYMGFPEVNKGPLLGDSYGSNWGCKSGKQLFLETCDITCLKHTICTVVLIVI